MEPMWKPFPESVKIKNIQDVEKLYKSLFDSDKIRKYIRKHVEFYLKELNNAKTEELRRTLKVPSDENLADWIINFMKDYCEKKIEDGAGKGKAKKKSKAKNSKAKKSKAKSTKAKKSKAKSPKPSVAAGLLTLTSKDDSKKTGWTEYLKEKLLHYLPKIIELGVKVSKKLIELSMTALSLCSTNFVTSTLCYGALFSLCTVVNSYNLESLDWPTYLKVYALQTLCQYVPMPFRLSRDKQKENRQKFTDDIRKKAAEQGLSSAVEPILKDYKKNPFANLRGTDMKQKKQMGDLLKGIGLKM